MELGHFGSVSRANRRLRSLADERFLRRAYVAAGPHQNATVYLIGPAGVEYAVEDCCLDPLELKRQSLRQRERMYLEHHLGVLSLRLVAERVAGGVQLVRFLAEPECRHEYQVVGSGKPVRRLIKPDAFALFKDNDGLLPVFIEFDRGNASLPQMARMFRRYCSYWTDTAFQAAYSIQTPFAVAVVTTAGQRRIDHLVGLTKQTSVPFIFSTFPQVETEGLDSSIWLVSSGKNPKPLSRAARDGVFA